MMNVIILPCAKGSEQVLAEEAQSLGLRNIYATTAVVRGEGDLETAYRLCLYSRVASRVLWQLVCAPISSPDDLYQVVHQIAWDEHIAPENTLAVSFNGIGKNQNIHNTHFAGLKVKDAIVDKLSAIYGRRPNVDVENPDIRVDAHLHKGEVTIAIDLSGHALHKRGYRLAQGAAPIKENLAATLLYRAKWQEKMHTLDTLIDPMCGAGTLLLEAWLMAVDQAPALHCDTFGFSAWQSHRPALWRKILQEAQERAQIGRKNCQLRLIGLDQDKRTLGFARENFARLGIIDNIRLETRDIAQFAYDKSYGEKGMIVCNPPYGERLGTLAGLLPVYSALGDGFKSFPEDWSMAVITSDPQLAKRMRLSSHRQYQAYNGKLHTTIYLYERHAQREVQGEKSAHNAVAEMFANRLKKNLKGLQKWLNTAQTNAYRIYDKDMPEYAFAIDRYGDKVLLQEYAPPASVDPKASERRLLDAIEVLPQVLNIEPEQIVSKTRSRQQGKQQYQKQAQTQEEFVICEGSAKYLVNLQDYLDTGLFLDHRSMRRKIFAQAKDKRFLNLFCYTASVSVQAALGGAKSSVSVDLSRTYLDWAWRNFDLNGLNEAHELVQADVMHWLEECTDTFDLIFCDPPTFSNTKKKQRTFDVQSDHESLISLSMARLAPDGVLYFSTNYRNFKMADSLQEAFTVCEISKQTFDPDFARNQKIHYVWEIRHKNAKTS